MHCQRANSTLRHQHKFDKLQIEAPVNTSDSMSSFLAFFILPLGEETHVTVTQKSIRTQDLELHDKMLLVLISSLKSFSFTGFFFHLKNSSFKILFFYTCTGFFFYLLNPFESFSSTRFFFHLFRFFDNTVLDCFYSFSHVRHAVDTGSRCSWSFSERD